MSVISTIITETEIPKNPAAEPMPEKPMQENQIPPGDPGLAAIERCTRQRASALLVWRKVDTLLLPIFAAILFLAAWQIYCQTMGERTQIPSPIAVVQATWDPYIKYPFFYKDPNNMGLGWNLLSSLGRVAKGYLLAALVGIVVGGLVGVNKTIYKAIDPHIQIARSVPPLAWLPLSLAFLQQSGPAAVFVIFITAVWPIILNTAAGIGRVPQDYRNVAAVFKFSRWTYVTRVLFPSAAPYVFTGLRIAIGMAWLAIVAAEMLTGGQGIGFFIWDAWNSSNLPQVFIALMYIGAAGFILDRAVALLTRLVVVE